MALLALAIGFARSSAQTQEELPAQIRSEARIGITRQDLYEILKHHGLVAYNPVLQHYSCSRFSCQPLDRGQWPKARQTPQPMADPRWQRFFSYERGGFNSANPSAIVEYSWAFNGLCSTNAFQNFYFDNSDHLLRIEDVPATRQCI